MNNMSIINYISHGEDLFFQTNEEFYENLRQAMPNSLFVHSFAQYLSRRSPKEIFEMRKQVNYLLDCEALNLPTNELVIFDCECDDDWIFLICSERKFRNETVGVMNKIADYYDLDFHVREINKLTIVVVDSDYTYLTDQFPVPGITLWHDVAEFIGDTQFHADTYYHKEDLSIETYDDAVKYWEEIQYFQVISNYVANDLEKNEIEVTVDNIEFKFVDWSYALWETENTIGCFRYDWMGSEYDYVEGKYIEWWGEDYRNLNAVEIEDADGKIVIVYEYLTVLLKKRNVSLAIPVHPYITTDFLVIWPKENTDDYEEQLLYLDDDNIAHSNAHNDYCSFMEDEDLDTIKLFYDEFGKDGCRYLRIKDELYPLLEDAISKYVKTQIEAKGYVLAHWNGLPINEQFNDIDSIIEELYEKNVLSKIRDDDE